VTVQHRGAGHWRAAGRAETDAAGRYAFTVTTPGRYRVLFRGERGPAVTIR
jgi:protocatechuate 3,4-dioxygenase beta subunit